MSLLPRCHSAASNQSTEPGSISAVATSSRSWSAGPSSPQRWLPGSRSVAPLALGEGVDRPDRRDAERGGVRTRHVVEAVVGVPRLARSAGVQADRLAVRQQPVGLQRGIEDRQRDRVLGEIHERPAARSGCTADVSARPRTSCGRAGAPARARSRRRQRPDLVTPEYVLDDHAALLAQHGQGRRTRPSRGSTRPSRSRYGPSVRRYRSL